ncbi:TRAP transporter permease [Rhodobaculum claviforme]|uniref:TRAP transporter permease DctM/Q n=1 Tax=Rhodobaculum claviforme TaxID=1549854 RepID=A0A934TLT1_9RHOB|nr:TRAP transporter fused permease subunit [Rhodobaculum claviforme]MBK5927507.1 TRAP transporter permease DctM/Q [Rhodobaculum claviforme]
MTQTPTLFAEARGIPADAPLAGPLRAIRPAQWAVGALALGTVGFHLYLVWSGLIPALVVRPIHLMLALPWIFLLSAPANAWERWSGPVFLALGLWAAGYIMWNQPTLVRQFGSLRGEVQMAVAVTLILVVLEAARRAIKWVLPMVAALVLAYGFFGQHIPGDFGHDGLRAAFFLGTLTITEGGLWSSLTGISAEVIAPFIILGALISAGTAGTGFMALATQVAGRARAGAAKVAVVASALYGSISGVAAANTASTGMVTIPAMIRLGYPRTLAAATEAVASTGGQIMPPLMGAGIFVMAELLARPYTEIMVAASLPALLFFATAWVAIHQYAIRYGLMGLSREEMPGWIFVARTVPFFAVPFGILIWVLAGTSYTAPYAASAASAVMVLLLAIDSTGALRMRRWAARIWQASEDAARQIASIAAIIICASLIVGVFNMTGLGIKITALILSASGENLWIALLLTGLAALVLGMELPTTAAYVICVAVAGPALVALGLPELYAHLFVFWYALLCTITPPVCGNVFIAAGIAKAPWLAVAGRSMSVGLGLFIVPLAFVANPSLLQLAEAPVWAVLALLKILAGLYLISRAVVGTLPGVPARIAAALAGLAVIFVAGV